MTTSRVQLALNVTDLEAATQFYSDFFGVEPAKRRQGYTNFAVDDPPLKLVLFENPTATSALNHLGVEAASTDDVTAAAARFAAAGLATRSSSAERCCHAVQDKVWVTAPDVPNGGWEFYTVLADDPDPAAGGTVGCCTDGAATTWRLLHADMSTRLDHDARGDTAAASVPIGRTSGNADTTQDGSAILGAVAAMAPAIAARSDEIERSRRLPADLIDELSAAGCFRMLAPRSHGGAEASLPTHLRMIEQLAMADGSVGWTVMIGCLAPIAFGHLSRDMFDALYADGPDVIVAGTYNPTGTATPSADGYVVSGRWSFASGCQHCHWFLAHSIVDDGRVPPMQMMVLHPDDVEITDTWSVSGLCGTGSHDFIASDVFVPAARTFSLFGEPSLDIALLRIPELSFSSLEIATVAIGIARGALADITTLATAKMPAFGVEPLAANPLFQHQLADADARLRAARSLIDDDAELAWATAVEGAPFTTEHRARIRAAATWAAQTAAAVVDTAYTAGGGSSIYTASPLQRRMRDIHALTQHFIVKNDTFSKAGAVLAGQQTDTTFL